MSRLSIALFSLILLAPVDAQIYRQDFSGNALPADMQVRRGTWTFQGGHATQTVGTWGYLTHKSLSFYNCVVECDVTWLGTGAIQFGGVAARHDGSANDNACMVKVQSDSTTVTGFDALWNYERPGTANFSRAIAPPMTKTRIRLLCVGSQGWLQHDSNQDGIYDLTTAVKSYTAHTAAGEVGVTAYTTVAALAPRIDNFAVYNAVLMDEGTTTPKIGTTHKMTLTTQHTQITPFVCALSLSNGTKNGTMGGIPLGGGKYLPLALDPVFDASLASGGALGLSGVTDSQGVGTVGLIIPNFAPLVGQSVYIAGVTFGSTAFENISNDHRLTFTN